MSFFQNGAIVHQVTITATAGGTTTLTASYKQYQIFTGTSNQTVQLPDATTMKNGMPLTIINDSTGTITVNYNDASLATTVPTGTSKDLVLFDNSSSNGSFDISVNSSSGGGASQADLNLLRTGQLNSASPTSVLIKINSEELGSNAWTSKSFNPNAITQQSNGFSFNGFGYNFAGANGGGTGIQTNARFDDTNNYWLVRGNLNTGSFGAATFQGGGYGYICGGSNNTGTFGAISPGRTEQYNDSLNSWATKTALPTAQAGNSGWDFNDGYGYSAGGINTGGSFFNPGIVQQYDITNDSWTTRANLIVPHSNVQAFVLNDNAYVCMSRESATAAGEKYNRVTGTWTAIQSASSSEGNSMAFSSLGFGYVVGGDSNTNRTRQYSDISNSWVNLASTTTSRGNGDDAVVINNVGYTNSTSTVAIERYSNASLAYLAINKRLASAPTNILALAKLKDLTFFAPVQIRTDGDSWKTVSANDASSILKTGQTLATKFLPYGDVYIVGGAGASPTYTSQSTSELYSPTSNVWTVRGSMITGRAAPFSFAIGGAGYVSGGFGPTLITHAALTSTEKYDEIANSFSSKTAIPSGAGNGAAMSILEFGYAWGGGIFGDAIGTTPTANYQYNATLDSWTTKTTIPNTFAQCTGWSLNDRGYISSGSPDTGGSTQAIGYNYNPINDAWLSIANAPNADRQVHGHSQNGFGYRVSGVSVSSVATHKYDVSTNSWSTVASLNAAGTNGAGLSSGGVGYSVNTEGGAQSESYNDEANLWTTRGSTNTARRQPACNFTPGVYRNYEMKLAIPNYIAGTGASAWITKTSLPEALFMEDIGMNMGGFGVTAGGNDGSVGIVRCYTFDFEANAWTRIGSMSTARSAGGATPVNGYDYAFGGVTDITSTERLDPSTKQWTNVSGVLNQGRWSVGTASLNGCIYALQGATSGGLIGSVEQYNPNTNAWVTKAATSVFSETRGNAVRGFVYTSGGHNGGTPTTFHAQYDDASNAWTTKGSMNIARRASGTFVVNGKITMAGGTGVATAEQYNDATNTWGFVAPMSGNRDYCGGFSVNEQGLTSGGSGPVATTEQFYSSLTNLILQAALDIT